MPLQKRYQEQDNNSGLVGLQNLGNTCYMNCALQALSNCPKLTRFVLHCPDKMKKQGVSESYSDLIKEIWEPTDAQYAVPAGIIRNIKCIYPAFRGCSQQDAQEFLRCFLEQLHEELKRPSKKLSLYSNLSKNEDEKQISNSTNHRSIISDTFEFKISSSVVCSNCNNISTIKETFKDLSIPIPSRDHPFYSDNNSNEFDLNDNNERDHESGNSCSSSNSFDEDTDSVTKSSPSCSNKSSDNQSEGYRIVRWFWSWFGYFGSWFISHNVTLQDCLSIFFGTDPLEGDNEYSCEVCTKKNRGVKFLKIIELPEVLCIHFKRYESVNAGKITTHVSFPLTGMDLSPYMSSECKQQHATYKLIACICHHGSALLTGHYTTFALNCYDNQWYEFDDQFVTLVEEYEVERSEAYILFYQKMKKSKRKKD